jgi:histidinol phosphatase-like enzyme
MHVFNDALCRTLAASGVHIDGAYCCVFHPTEGHGEYRRESPLRKPAPGMILQAAGEHGLDLRQSFAIGDRMSDVLAGHAAGCRTILLGGELEQRNDAEHAVRPGLTCTNLIEAAEWIERVGRTSPRVSTASNKTIATGQLR